MKTTIYSQLKQAGVLFKKHFERFDIVFFAVLFVFSFWLMFHTFSYDSETHSFQVAFKLWSDFSAHIPLIRSFSMGDNLTRFIHGKVEYPIFPGEPIRYHYLFFMFVGILEKLGIRIDWALNVPSTLGFFLTLAFLYLIAKKLFQSTAVGVLTVIFFLFNGSLGFLRFFTLHPLSINTFTDIVRAKDFPAFAPWGPGEITAFWNLNIYTNQRHLAVAFALVLFYLYTVITRKKTSLQNQITAAIPWGILFGIFPYFHPPSLIILAIFLICYFLLFPEKRMFLFATGVISAIFIIPQLFLLQNEVKAVEWYPGYIIHNELLAQQKIPLMLWHMITFWWQNLGLHSILIPLGFFLIPKNARRAILPIIPLFIIPNLFKFSVEASANHKLFNFVMAMGDMISAYILVTAWKLVRTHTHNILLRIYIYAVVIICIVFLTLTGIIDFFVVFNDTKGSIADIPANEVATWIYQNTPSGAVFLNSSYLYHPASIAGRPIFLGWPYFAWSAGYKENRMPIMNIMYESRDKNTFCPIFAKYHISYVTVENVTNDPNLPNINLSYFLKTYRPVFLSRSRQYAIFTTQTLCR